MIKIILIDDDERNYLTLKNIVSKLDILYSKNLIIKWYPKYNEELDSIINDTGTKKIYFVNNKYNFKRQDLACYIRNTDYRSELILLGNHFRKWINNIFDFLPNIFEHPRKISQDIKNILDNYYIGNMFKYKNRKFSLNIYYDNILFIYRDTSERKVIIVTDNNKYALCMSLNEVKKHLDFRFKQVHRACLLNICRVQEYNWANNYFVLDNGQRIGLLSKKYRSNFETKI